jgi:hypothetical protein
MATLIEAIIFDGDPYTAAVPPGMRTVPLQAGLTTLPVSDEVVSQLDPNSVGDERVPSGWMLQQPVAALGRALSADRRVLYIVSETFGGPGTKEAIAWHGGRPLYGPSGTYDIEADLEPGYYLAREITPSTGACGRSVSALPTAATSTTPSGWAGTG